MARFAHVMFVCQNDRDPSDSRGSCTGRGAEGLLDRLKALTKEHGLKGKVRITSSGCLDLCAKGCAAAVFSARADDTSDETYYVGLAAGDADELFERHILKGERWVEHVEPQSGASPRPKVG